MIGTLVSILGGLFSGPLSNVSKDLKEAYQSRLQAETDKDKLIADDRIKTLEAQKTIILAAQSDPIERWVRVGIAFPFVIYINKLVLWDKVFSLGVTDPLGDSLTQIMMLVLAGYFVDTTVRRIFKGK